MENTIYEWTISTMECKINEGVLNDVVIVVHWRLNATRNGKTAETYSATAMPEVSEENFTPYNELTKEQVVSWLVTILSIIPEPVDNVDQSSQLARIQEDLNANIDLQLNPINELLPPPFL